nr:reverse transcriptase domain-containing protein [Tanacetum cinerariifolium]
MSTQSSARNLFPPLENPKLTIRRRTRVDPNLLNDFNMATNGSGDDGPPPNGRGDLLVLDLRTMEELCQPTSNGRGNSINTFDQMAKIFLEKYLPPSMVTKLRNAIANFCHEPDESLFKAWERYNLSIDRRPNHNMLPMTQIDTFYNGLTLRHRNTINAAAGGTFMKRRLKKCYDLIENMTAHHNDWDTSAQKSESSSSITSCSDPKIVALKDEMAKINKNLMKALQINQQVKAVTLSYETCGGLHSYNDCPATVGQTQNEDLKGNTTRSGIAYQGPMIPTTSYPPKVVKHETEMTKDTEPPTNNGSTKDVQPLTERALIDVYEGELTLRVGKKAVPFNLDQTSRYSSNYDDNLVNRIDVIDVACEEYSQEVLGFSMSGNPNPSTEPIFSTSFPTLTPFVDSDFLLEETDAFLATDDEPVSPEINDSYYDSEGYILLLEEFLNDDPSSPPLPPQELKIARPMTRLLKKDTPFIFSKECIEAFQTLKKKLTEAPILVALDWDLPLDLMCDASDFTIGAVLGQRKTKHFQSIRYASKTMTDAQAHYTTMEKQLPAVVYAFEKFWPYLVLSKSIVYTDHSTLKYLFNKQDAKLRFLRWVLLLQEFDITVRDKKGAENLAADHLSRLENPNQSVLDKKKINETLPLETLNMVSFRGDSSTPWFADFANYHAGNFVVKGMSSQQKNKFVVC